MNATARKALPCADPSDRITKPASPARTHTDRASWSPDLYAWDINSDDPQGQAGVTDDRSTAIGHVRDALADATPGASGKIRRVALSGSGSGKYIELGTEVSAHVDEATGAVVWTS